MKPSRRPAAPLGHGQLRDRGGRLIQVAWRSVRSMQVTSQAFDRRSAWVWRHVGDDQAILARRARVYAQA